MFEALARDRGMRDERRRAWRRWSRARASGCRTLLRSGSVLFPGAAEFIREAAAAVPIAIASGALRHEIDEIIDAAGVADLFATIVAAGDTPREQAVAGAVSAGVRAAARADGRDARSATLGRHRGLALGARIGTRRGSALVGVTNSYPADELTAAELVVEGSAALTLPALDQLCAS